MGSRNRHWEQLRNAVDVNSIFDLHIRQNNCLNKRKKEDKKKIGAVLDSFCATWHCSICKRILTPCVVLDNQFFMSVATAKKPNRGEALLVASSRNQKLLRERVQQWRHDLSYWKRRAVFEHGIPTVIVEKACVAYNDHRLHNLGKDDSLPQLDDEWFQRHLQDMTQAVIKQHRCKILDYWLNQELNIPLSDLSSHQLIPAAWLDDEHWRWVTVQGKMSLIQQLRFDCSLSAWRQGNANHEVSRWPAATF